MEDLIKELAVQAGAELFGVVGKENIIVNDRDADELMRKFAQLIVHKCLEILETECFDSPPVDDDWFNWGEVCASLSCSIEKQFGVEQYNG